MNYILLAAFLIGFFVGATYAELTKENFDKLCRKESKLLSEFNAADYDTYLKLDSWHHVLDVRGFRNKVGKVLNLKDCFQVEPVVDNQPIVVLNDEQLFQQQCAHEKQFELELANCQDPLVKNELERLYKESKHISKRLAKELHQKDCPSTISADDTKQGKISSALRQHFYQTCSEEIIYDYMDERLDKVRNRVGFTLWFDLNAGAKQTYGRKLRKRKAYCQGSVEECCGKELVERAKNEASLRSVEIMMRTIGGSEPDLRNKRGQSKETVVANRIKSLKNLEKIYKLDMEKEKDEANKNRLKAASELIYKRYTELEATSGQEKAPKKSKFRMFKW